MSFIRSVENELDKNVLHLEIDGFQVSLNKPSFITFGKKQSANGSHRHNVFEICQCISGEGIFVCGSERYRILKHSTFVGPPLIPHEILCEPGKSLQIMYFVASFSRVRPEKEQSFTGRFLEGHKIMTYDHPEISSYSTVFKGRTMGTPSTDSIIRALLLDCLSALREDKPVKSETERAIAFIDKNSHRSFSVAELASALSMSERALYYFFKAHFDMSPRDFINKRRMEAALEYLRMGISPGHVSDMLKFTDPSSFCRMFKKYYGISPVKVNHFRQ